MGKLAQALRRPTIYLGIAALIILWGSANLLATTEPERARADAVFKAPISLGFLKSISGASSKNRVSARPCCDFHARPFPHSATMHSRQTWGRARMASNVFHRWGGLSKWTMR
jgi:hypothetical protein